LHARTRLTSLLVALAAACSSSSSPRNALAPQEALPATARVGYLHHSTGGNVWAGGVAEAIAAWNAQQLVEGATDLASAQRAQQFFAWVKDVWDEPGDNVYVWDFFQLETGGGPYLLPEHAADATDSHPNATFSAEVAPLVARRIVDVVEARGDLGSRTGA
jgi:hypothetical protein